MPTFHGVGLGLVQYCNTSPNPKARQVTDYPGVDGLEVLDLGARGGATRLRTVLTGSDLAGLAAAKSFWFALQQDGGAYTLVDLEGTTWTGVILAGFEPAGPPMWIAGNAGYAQVCEFEFLHVGD